MASKDTAAGNAAAAQSNDKPAVKRQNGSFVHVYEQRLLQFLVRRLPRWVSSDMLTLFGVVGSIMTGLAWYWALDNRMWLLMGNLGLFIHWYGDSLDGLAARHRDLSRPTYGFFVDILADVVSAAFWMAGAAAGPLCGEWFWMPIGVILPLFMMIVMLDLFNVALSPKREHNIDAAGVSGTEARIALAALNFAIMGVDDTTAISIMQATIVAFGAFGAIFIAVRSVVFGRMLREIDDAKLAERQAARCTTALAEIDGPGKQQTQETVGVAAEADTEAGSSPRSDSSSDAPASPAAASTGRVAGLTAAVA